MADGTLVVEGLRKAYGGIVALDEVDLTVAPGQIHAVIGPNGAGKTTLVSLLGGAIAADAGRILFDGADLTRFPAHARARRGVARSFQITSIFPDMTIRNNVVLAVLGHEGLSHRRFWSPVSEDSSLAAAAESALAQVGLAASADRLANELSHGEHRELEIAMALAISPRLLLLDEPMAGLGPEESARMVDLIHGLHRTHAILLVEHDMDAVFALADRITVLVNGRVIASGLPAEIRSDASVRQAYLGEEVAGHA